MRLHVHLKTQDLKASVAFYTALFGPPALLKDDYAKWEPEQFPVIVALSLGEGGVDHLGLKGNEAEITAVTKALVEAGFCGTAQNDAACCYTVADKVWAVDPSGVPHELYTGHGSIEVFGADRRPALANTGADACCIPAQIAAGCCEAPTEEVPDSITAFLLRESV